ncbi:MAG: DMT family transporter [Lachnospirales bacterium]
MFKNDKVRAYIAAFIFSILVGFSFIGIKVCQELATELETLTYRFNFGFIASGVTFLVIKIFFKKETLAPEKKSKKIMLITAISYVGFMTLQIIGIFYTTSVLGSIIFSITPITVQLMAIKFLKEKANFKQSIFIAITASALIYMILVGTKSLELNFIGVVCLLLASLSMAIANIGMRYIRKCYTPLDVTFYICTTGFIFFNTITIITGMIDGTLINYFNPVANFEFLIATAYLGVGCIFITSQLMAFMLGQLETIKVAVFGNFSMVVSILAGIIILNEPFYLYHFICAGLVLTGVIGVSFYGNK